MFHFFNKIKIIILGTCLLFLNLQMLQSKNLQLYTSSRAKGMGNTFTGVSGSIEGIFYNPASVGSLLVPQISLEYHSIWLGLHDGSSINKGDIYFCYPIKNICVVGISLSEFKVDEAYKESLYGLLFSKNFSKEFSVGLNVKYLTKGYNFDGIDTNSIFKKYGNLCFATSIDLGILFKPSSSFSLGAAFFDINQPNFSIEPGKENLPFHSKVGLSITPGHNFIICGDFTYYNELFLVSFGIEKEFQGTYLRGGCNFNGKNLISPSLGIGYKFNTDFGGIIINYSFVYPLGVVVNSGHHSFGFSVEFSKTEQKKISLDYQKETLKTAAEIKIYLSKNVIKKEDKELTIHIEIGENIKEWEIQILDSKGRIIKNFIKEPIPILWNLRNQDGKLLSKGRYYCVVVGVDVNNNKIVSEKISFVVAEKLEEIIKEETYYCPNCGGEVIKGERFCPLCGEPLKK